MPVPHASASVHRRCFRISGADPSDRLDVWVVAVCHSDVWADPGARGDPWARTGEASGDQFPFSDVMGIPRTLDSPICNDERHRRPRFQVHDQTKVPLTRIISVPHRGRTCASELVGHSRGRRRRGKGSVLVEFRRPEVDDAESRRRGPANDPLHRPNVPAAEAQHFKPRFLSSCLLPLAWPPQVT